MCICLLSLIWSKFAKTIQLDAKPSNTMKTLFVHLLLAILSNNAFSLKHKRLLLHDPISVAEAIQQLGKKFEDLNSTVAQMKISHTQEIAQINAKHAQDIGQLDAIYSQEVAKMKSTHFQDIALLNATHHQDVANLKAEHAKEVADLKAGLNAEKLERCRIGSLFFHHEECAKQQCSESRIISFSPPFTKVPIVTHAFSSMDVYEGHNLRISSSVSAVTTSSAKFTVSTWADSIVYGSTLNWIACPSL